MIIIRKRLVKINSFKFERGKFLFVIFSISLCFSCVEKKTGKDIQNPPPAKEPGPRISDRTKTRAKREQGVWHTVERGQTLWRICKTYGVDMERVIKENDIDDPRQIAVGQKIFIPGAKELKYVEPAPQLIGAGKTGSISDGKTSKVDISPSSGSSGKLLWPVDGGVVFSPFGKRNGQFHEGIDISAPAGTAIYAVDDGKVVYSDDRIRGYGNMIVIKHSGNLSTVYAHNRVNLVKEGDFVRRGQKIAEVGMTGNATGNHLHFEVRVGKEAVDPMRYLEKKR